MIYRFVSWNVNGIRAIARKSALKWIDKEKVDILALQEIKATKEQIPKNIFDKKFSFLQVSSASIPGRSRVALFSNIEPVFTSDLSEVDILKEGRINEFHFSIKEYKIAFFNVYFPNGQMSEERLAHKLEFYDKFLDYCQKLKTEGKSIIICGDVNTAHTEIDLKRPKPNEKTSGFLPIERAWLDKFISSGYIDTFRYINGNIKDKYTWWSYKFNARKTNAGWRIDYFFVSNDLKENIKNATIEEDIQGSDHCPVTLEIEL